MNLTEPARKGNWLPISTAPRDGTNILLRFGIDGVSQARFIPGLPHPWRFIDTADGITWLINSAVDGPGGPSHWQPMPGADLPVGREQAGATAQTAADEEPSAKQKKLMELADRIDHEQLWRWAGMDHHKMTPEQRDRMNAGVALRRYARLWAPGHWVVFPPVGPVSFSATTLDKAVEMAKRDDVRRAGSTPATAELNQARDDALKEV